MNLVFYLVTFFLSITTFGMAATQAVIFDFGGVVIEQLEKNPYPELAQRFKLPVDKVEEYIKSRLPDLQTGKINEKELWFGFAFHFKVLLPLSLREELDAWYLKNNPLNPQTVEIVKALKQNGYRTPLLSDTNISHARLNRSKNRYDLFDPILLSHEIGVMKNDPQAFLIALDALGLGPEECIFIDDHIENVEMAQSVGIDGILFTSADALREALLQRGINL